MRGGAISGWWMRCNPGMIRRALGNLAVNRHRRPILSGWTIVVLGVATLVLGACGRKAGLDLPPTAYAPTAPAAAPMDTQADTAAKPGLFNPGYGMDAPPAAAKGRKKAFVLDPLLD